MKRSPMVRRPRFTGPVPGVVEQVTARDLYLCVVDGAPVHGQRGRDWSVQHRLRRGVGGTRRPDINLPSNLVTVHGSGTTGCHGQIEANPAWALEYGWRVPDGVTPPSRVLMWHAGYEAWVYLTDDGLITSGQPEVAS